MVGPGPLKPLILVRIQAPQLFALPLSSSLNGLRAFGSLYKSDEDADTEHSEVEAIQLKYVIRHLYPPMR